ncbi:MAG: tetratricopeptide repeat protein [Chloroflexota bacterium]
MKTIRILLSAWLALAIAGCSLGPVTIGPLFPAEPTIAPVDPSQPTTTLTAAPIPTPIPAVRVDAGDRALFYGDYLSARNEYQIALTGTTDSEVQAAAIWGLGRVEYEDGNLALALEYLRRVRDGYPSSRQAAYASFLLGEAYMELNRYAEAAEAYTHYLTVRPGVIDAYAQERLGNAHALAGETSAAILAYQAAAAAGRISATEVLQIRIAQAYANAGDTATALAMYESLATQSTNDYIKAQMDLLSGQLYLSLGQTDLGYQKLLHTVDNYPLAYDSYTALVILVNAGVPVNELDRGLVDYFAGAYGVALAAFDRYMAANPVNDGTVRYYRALTLRELTRHAEAVDEFTFFILNYSENRYWQAAWEEKAYTQWVYLSQYDLAAQTLLDYVAIAPGSSFAPQMLLSAGRILERAGRLDDAASTWESIADAYPSSSLTSQGLFWAGIARYRAGNLDSALLTFQRSLLFSLSAEDQSRAHFWIGKTQQRRGDAAAAQTVWQLASNLDPTGYYSERANDVLLGRGFFTPPDNYDFKVDLERERRDAEAWLRVTFNLTPETDLSQPGALLQDGRLIRGSELWELGLYDEARLEFEDLRLAVSENPADSYRLANYLIDLGLYRSGIIAARQVLTLAGLDTHAESLTGPQYFSHIRYGLYYPELVIPTAEQYGFHPLFLYAVIRQESLYEGFVRSGAGARGLMQIIPTTGDSIAQNMGWPPEFSSEDLYRPLVSVTLGTYHLRSNVNYFDGDLYPALAAYNAGLGNAAIWYDLTGGDPDLYAELVRFEETRTYIRRIYEIFVIYRTLYGTIP